jgi:hypothetical protein
MRLELGSKHPIIDGSSCESLYELKGVRVRWFDHRCKVNSDEFDRVQERTGWRFLSQVAG